MVKKEFNTFMRNRDGSLNVPSNASNGSGRFNRPSEVAEVAPSRIDQVRVAQLEQVNIRSHSLSTTS